MVGSVGTWTVAQHHVGRTMNVATGEGFREFG